MALSADQLTDFQADIGIGSDAAVFTDAELNRLYARASDDYDLAVAMAFEQLMSTAAKLNNYVAGSTAEEKSQVFAQLEKMADRWLKKAGYGAPSVVAGTIEQDLIEPYSITEYA